MITRTPVVLFIDDHEDTVDMYARGLSALGFQPVIAVTVDDAFLRACMNPPQVIVADLHLSVRSGCDLIHRLRDDPRTRAIPIIVLTCLTLVSVRDQAREAGCQRLLLKPCLPATLAGEIRDALLAGKTTSPSEAPVFGDQEVKGVSTP